MTHATAAPTSANAATTAELPRRRARVTTPFVQQMEAVECGAAALGALLAHYGRWEQMIALRRACGVSRDGSRAANVLRAARSYGMEAKGLKRGLDSIRNVPVPYVVFWDFNHFLVVEGYDTRHVFLNDPAVGHRRVTWDQFNDSFTGVVLQITPGPAFVPGGKKPRVLPDLWSRTAGTRGALAFVLAAGLISAIAGIAAAAFTRIIVDEVIVAQRGSWLRPILIAMIVTMLFQLASQSVSQLFTRRMKLGMAARLQAQFTRHLLHLPMHFFNQRQAGEVVSRAEINSQLTEVIAGRLTAAGVGLISMLAYGLVLVTYNPVLTAIGLCMTLLNFALLRRVASRRVEANLEVSREAGKLNGITHAGLASIRMLKANGMENAFYERWAGSFAKSSAASQRLQLDNKIFGALPGVTQTLVNLLTMVLGGLYVIEGTMSLGELMAFAALMGMFLGPVQDILNLSTEAQQIRGNLARLGDVMDAPTQADAWAARYGPSQPDQDNETLRLDGSLTVEGVSFGYQPLEPPLLKDVSFHLPPRQMLALVGGSGSGKSTMARLIAGLLIPDTGEIRLDRRRHDQIDPVLRAASIGFVDQDIQLYAGSIRDNLTLWDDTIPDLWVSQALDDAGLLEDVMAMPGGLDARLVENGSNLSGGQRQRLEIARALVRRPSLLILDEATSALDTATEAHVLDRLRRRNCTIVSVAHRLSTVRAANRILVLRRGKIVQDGDYDTLWATRGPFQRLLRDG